MNEHDAKRIAGLRGHVSDAVVFFWVGLFVVYSFCCVALGYILA